MNIRLITHQDCEKFHQLIEENRIFFRPYFPKTIEQITDLSSAQNFINERINVNLLRQGYYFIIEIENQLIGVVTLKEIDWQESICELAYFIDKSQEGKGIISKTIKEVILYCISELNLEKIYARVNPFNIASKKVLEKNGFTKEKILLNNFKNEKGVLEDVEYYEKHILSKFKID